MRIFDFIEQSLLNYGDSVCFGQKYKGEWKTISCNEYLETSTHISSGLLNAGLSAGDRVITLSENRPEWNFTDLGMIRAGIINVPVYPTISDGDLEHILKETKAEVLFASNRFMVMKARNVSEKCHLSLKIFSYDAVDGVPAYTDLAVSGKASPVPEKIKSIQAGIRETDVYTILYTSGTTGQPKGVMLSHRSHLSIIRDLGERIAPEPGFRALSYLPLNHIFERTVCFMYQSRGVSIYYAEGLGNIQANFMEVQPDCLSTVPMLLEKVYGQIVAYANKFEGAQRELYEAALKLATGFTFEALENPEFKAKYDLVNEHVFSKWRGFLGGKLKRVMCGGAAMQKDLFNLYWATGIPIMQGYGLSETSGLIAIDRYGAKIKLNKCGNPMNDIEVKIAEDGEILARGIPIMPGYYKQPELTAHEIDEEGWFHSGDFGELDEDNFLQYKGRKKAFFKNSSGQYINPEEIENIVKKNAAIRNILITGHNQPWLGALIIADTTRSKEESETAIRLAVKTYNASQIYDSHRILSYILLQSEWTIEGGELTPTLKIRRNTILEKYQSEIKALFDNNGKAIRIETDL